jgi:hypothetical protein
MAAATVPRNYHSVAVRITLSKLLQSLPREDHREAKHRLHCGSMWRDPEFA